MKLLKCHVTNFRSVNDSTEFDTGQRTCLVGKNEAGKTAILLAIYGLKPIYDFEYSVERDYPRADLNDYEEKYGDTHARVIKTRWTLEESDVASIESVLGQGVLSSKEISVTRSFESENTTWAPKLNEQKVVENIIASASLNAAEATQVGKPANVEELVSVVGKLDEPTEKQTGILAEIDTFRERRATLAAIDALKLPHFMYFSHYSRMSGQVSVERLISDTNESKVTEADSVFLDFLAFAGTSLEEIQAATTFESLNTKCEAASNKITDQIFEYWTQNDSLRIEVKVGRGEAGDPAPFNSGTVIRARVYNDLHRVSVPFSERSAGFIWFFSFLVKFAQVKKKHGDIVILLDEPGLTLHGKAQADLLRYFSEQLEPHHQLIFSTHSPFMVPANDISCVRVVEDVIKIDDRNRKRSEGTKVSSDALVTDRDTLFPLQGALGYELTQSLFIGPNTFLVEGPSEILYIQAFSRRLKELKRTPLSTKWAVTPSGGIGNMLPLVSLFAGNKLNVAVLADVAKGNKSALRRLEESGILEENQLYRITDFTGGDEGDVEDLLTPDLYSALINDAFSLPETHALTADKLLVVETNTERLVRKAEEYFKLLPPEIEEFDHYQASYVLLSKPKYLKSKEIEYAAALDNFEALFKPLNSLVE